MRQWKLKGFTLIELLIVVAIIAILAAIAVPNFLEAQVRSKVSRSKTDMRTIATGLEAYFVDTNTYVASGSPATDSGKQWLTVNASLTGTKVAASTWGGTTVGSGAVNRITFQTYRPAATPAADISYAYSMTTPVAYMTSLPSDPFADTKGCAFGYWNALDAGWIAWSYGPDTDEKDATTPNGQLQSYIWKGASLTFPPLTASYANFVAGNSVYNPYLSNPTVTLRTSGQSEVGSAFTYDSTNGTNSKGDVWRVKE